MGKRYTNPHGIELEVQPLSQKQSKTLLECTLAELACAQNKKPIPFTKDDLPWEPRAVDKRIEAFNLPIKFTPLALLSFTAFATNIGGAITILIDCLGKFEGQEVTVEKLCDLYPYGWYTEESFAKYVDEYLKPQKFEWAKVYVSRQ